MGYAFAASGSEKSAGVGGPKTNVPGALPVLTTANSAGGAALPISVVGKETVAGAPDGNDSVAPVGVTESGIATLGLSGSFVKRLSEPVTGEPAVADPTTAAVTV